MKKRRPKAYMTFRERFGWRYRKSLLSDWIVVKTKPNQERYAARHIRRQGHACLCPYITEEGSTREKPLFTAHIFVLGPDWYYLKSTYGVVSPIMFGDQPARMPKKAMRDILRRCGEDDVITIKAERFTAGQQVRFKRGAWEGWTGIFKGFGKDSKKRVRIMLRMLGGEHELEFDRGDITAQSKDAKS